MAEILFSFDVCVCLCAADRPVNNSSKTVKAMDLKFDKHVPSDSPDMNFSKGAWPGSCDPLNFCALNANSSKRLKLQTSNYALGGDMHSPECLLVVKICMHDGVTEKPPVRLLLELLVSEAASPVPT